MDQNEWSIDDIVDHGAEYQTLDLGINDKGRDCGRVMLARSIFKQSPAIGDIVIQYDDGRWEHCPRNLH